MRDTIQLVSTASSTAAASVTYTVSRKGKLRAVVVDQYVNSAGIAVLQAELSFNPTGQNNTNDANGVIASGIVSTPASAVAGTSQKVVPCSIQLEVGDRLYINVLATLGTGTGGLHRFLLQFE